MIEYVLMAIVFISLYISIVWISFLYLNPNSNKKRVVNYPILTTVTPCWNEEGTVEKTIRSIANLNYPKEKLEILIVDDCSTDKTREIIKKTIENIKSIRIRLISQEKNKGKSAAINRALKIAKGELFACIDADTIVDKDLIKNMLHHFEDPKTACVTSSFKVHNPKNWIEKMTAIEYLLANLVRYLMSTINTLMFTHGAGSVFRTSTLRNVGGFSTNTITEDFEIGMRLKFLGYNTKIELNSQSETGVPRTFKTLWVQRVRWFRGFIENHVKYRSMIFNRKYGLAGFFQMPLNIIGIPLLLISVFFIIYGDIQGLSNLILRSMLIKNYIFTYVLVLPSIKDFILTQNFKVIFPLGMSILFGLILLYKSFRITEERVRYPISIWLYFVILPIIFTMHWTCAFYHVLRNSKYRWR